MARRSRKGSAPNHGFADIRGRSSRVDFMQARARQARRGIVNILTVARQARFKNGAITGDKRMEIASLRKVVSAEEWQLRVELAACYRLVALYGWTDLVFTHISARVPGPEHHFLINPYGLMFDEITASSLVKVDKDCNKVIDSPYPVNPAGFVIHRAVHAAREDVQCV